MLEWGKMWVNCHNDSLKHIRVTKEIHFGQEQVVANAYCEELWLRRPLNSDVEPGIYKIGLDGGLQAVENYIGITYPDLSLKLPDFQQVTQIASLNVSEVEEIAQFVSKCADLKRRSVLLTPEGFQSGHFEDDEHYIHLPTGDKFKTLQSLNEDKKEVRFTVSLSFLTLAINEMLHYLSEDKPLLVLKENLKGAPLIFGMAPQACAFIGYQSGRVV